MTAKEYLNQAYHIDRRVESKLAQIESLYSLATRVTSVFSNTPHNCNLNNRSLEKTISKIVDLKKSIDDDIDKLVDLKCEITKAINEIENIEYRTILEMRYLGFKTWEEIAVALSYDVRHIYRLHGQALEKIKISERCH